MKLGELKLSTFNLLLISCVFLFLLPEFSWSNFANANYLWSEDGNVFIQQFNSMGAASLLKSYAGYLHFYPRLIMFLAGSFKLLYQPPIMCAGWFLAYFFMMYTLLRAARNLGANQRTCIFLLVLVSAQPHNGEVFFSLTNSQWLLGVSLFLLALIDDDLKGALNKFNKPDATGAARPSPLKIIILCILGLSGPYSIVLAPLLVIKAFVLKDLRKNYWIYLPVIICALIQGSIFVISNRLNGGYAQEWNTMLGLKVNPVPFSYYYFPVDWLISFFTVILFYATQNWLSLGSAVCFWLVSFHCFSKRRDAVQAGKSLTFLFLLLLLAACLLILAGMVSFKLNAFGMIESGNGCRYTWIPYSLIFFSVLCASQYRPKQQLALFLCALIFCAFNFNDNLNQDLLSMRRAEMHFKSFANFSRYRDVVIPINPYNTSFPGPSINIAPDSTLPAESVIDLPVSARYFKSLTALIGDTASGISIVSTKEVVSLIFNNKIDCKAASDIGIEIEMNRRTEGYTRFYWSDSGQFSTQQVLRRWYPSGKVRAQFAFPNQIGGVYFSFMPSERATARTEISKMTAYCLP